VRTTCLYVLAGLFSLPCEGQFDFRAATVQVLRDHVLQEAAWAMEQEPVTVTATRAPKSAGGKHDFFSEGDYWWPDPSNPGGPYVQRDGQSNPENFIAHRIAMIRFSQIVGALASAYVVTDDNKYVSHAFRHARAWFVDSTTLMNPSLLYAQAIQGRFTGRSIGIIDTIHLMEVAQGLSVMQHCGTVDQSVLASVKEWFSKYVAWLTTHPYGKDEMKAQNNHGTCWVMQVAAFTKFTGDQEMLAFCRERYKTVLLPDQMAADGSFPRELGRTKPYGYSLFNLDAMAMICQILSNEKDDLWRYRTADDKSVEKGIRFLVPFIEDKSKWSYRPDVMYWENWPVAQPMLVFAAKAFDNTEWFGVWEKLDHSPAVPEVIRNLPVRNPIIWLN